MVRADLFMRTFLVKGQQFGTAFELEVDGENYLFTASHLFDTDDPCPELWAKFERSFVLTGAELVGFARGIDIAVFKSPPIFGRRKLDDIPVGIASLAHGCELFFLGFPYKDWVSAGGILADMPMAFVKKGSLSAIDLSGPRCLFVDAINNEGFSGGPLFAVGKSPLKPRLVGVVSKFRIEYELLQDRDGNQLDNRRLPYNTGMLLAYDIMHGINMIRRKAGAVTPG